MLLMAHPGHELLVHGWLHREVPRVGVLTDGSTRQSNSRLESTQRLLERAGTPIGSLFGRHTDASLYERILDRDADLFTQLAREVSKEMVAEQIECVVGDAVEGYNAVHDLFRQVINTGVAIAERETGRAIENYEFALFNRPGPHREGEATGRELLLTGEAREQKFAAARSYAALDREVQVCLDRYGMEAYATEWLRPVQEAPGQYRVAENPPVYERFAEHLRSRGEFEHVIRYEQHLLPIATALGDVARHG